MQFLQTSLPELYAPQGAAATGPALYLLLPPGTSSPPASLGLAESWTAYPTAAYLFLPAPVAAGGEEAFATAAWAFLADPSLKTVRFAWLTGSTPVSGNVGGASAAVWQPAPGAWATSRSTTFGFRNLSLFLGPGAAVMVDDANARFTFGAAGAPPATLIAGWGAAPLPAVAEGPLVVAMTGALAGCLCFPAALAKTRGVPDVDTLDVGLRFFYGDPAVAGGGAFFLDSFRFPLLATEAQTLPVYAALDPLAPLDGDRTFLAFSPGDAGLSGAASGAVPSYFRSTLGEPLALLPQTGSGSPTGFARLVFAERPASSPPGPAEPLYLVPRGDFAVTGGGDVLCGLSGVEFVALGGNGDLVSFFPGQPAYAPGFFPGTPPGTVRLQPPVATTPTTSYATLSAPSGTLDYFAQPDESVLFNYAAAQPAGVTTLPALAPQQVLAATLPWPPADAAAFPLLAYAGAADPVGPAAYAQLESQVVSPLRRALLSGAQTRPRLSAPAGTPPASRYSTTPQGLLATYTPGAPVWDEVVLAQMAATGAQLLLNQVQGDLLSAFQSNQLFLVVSNPAALQSILLQGSSTVQIGADVDALWSFDLEPASWAAYGTILIVKFQTLSIQQLVGQPGAWAFPSTFNADPQTTAQALSGIIGAATGSRDADFAAFVNAVTNPAWNGMLALNVRAPLDELPAQLAGLAAGIDPAQFFAHHVGINASKVNVPSTPGDLTITDSSIFGLINYQAPGPLPATGADYQFQVQQLKVLFASSAVAGFSSTIQLQANTLFGEAATLREAPGNVVEMYGVYQKHESNGQTQESYAFQTPTGAPSVFDLASAVLNTVQLTGGQFVTVSPQQPSYPLAADGVARAGGTATLTTTQPHGMAAGDRVRVANVVDTSFNGVFVVAGVPSATQLTCAQPGLPDTTSTGGSVAATFIQSQFVFRGLADFQALPGFDVFSFGRQGADAPPAGLQFGNLIIEMDFDSEQTPITPAFTFNAGALSLDPAGSTARAGSFFSHFPLTVSALTQAKAGTTPADGGFMGVQTPLTQSALQSPWFSLNFNLDLGSPGALAAQAGFVATLAAAWSPGAAGGGGADGAGEAASGEEAAGSTDGGTGGYTVFVGLRLPGSSGAKRAVQIEGIFDITFRSLEVVAIPASDTFILVLYGIGFQFLRFTFPPTGQVNFVLFGDPGQGGAGTTLGPNPGQAGAGTTLGWYAAYAKPAQQTAAGTVPSGGGVLPPGNGNATAALPAAEAGEGA